jgi:K+-sensing histidine kinase KdpD
MLIASIVAAIDISAFGTLGSVRPAQFGHIGRQVEAACTGRSVMVCLSLDPSGFEALLRKGLETARRLESALYLVHVETPLESLRGGAKERLREVLDCAVAANRGVEVVWLKAWEPAKALLDFAQISRAQAIVVGRSGSQGPLARNGVLRKLTEQARHCAIEIVGFEN